MNVELISSSAVPKFERGVRLKHDRVRERHVVLGPEMLIELNQTGTAIMSEIDGQSNLSEIVHRLAERFEVNPQDINQDVSEFGGLRVLGGVLDHSVDLHIVDILPLLSCDIAPGALCHDPACRSF